ncbi:MAG: hypothetical protein ACIAXF_00115 [Phycisphaerales bacterium JB063]
MQQIKIFIGREDTPSQLSDEVNAWIAESGVNVLNISGNIAPQSVLPTKDPATGGSLGASATTRRFAPSDLMVMVTYEKA